MSEKLPYPVVGMSDEIPYTGTRYRDMTERMAGQFKAAFFEVLDEAIEKEKSGYYLMPSFVLPDGADKSTLSC